MYLMATAITLSSDSNNDTTTPALPECDQATCCYWFETIGNSSTLCANRNSMVCRKKREDVFAPFARQNLDPR
jgi:hypothetical protein